ncbi:MAG: hypothetical protein NW205_06140 [Hyphomicrobiaceae bacterium]|nr:hypothetical protein [Hyphomicrobiaceae bacterium]
MATLITVHGTFAHVATPPGAEMAPQGYAAPWWQPGSTFDRDLHAMLEAADGEIETVPFIWSGANSEQARRDAATALLARLRDLEARGEPYVLIGHSHGGSVISRALIAAATAGEQLPGLKRWITIGTPFVELKKERFLFQRLPLLLQALYVASIMLLVMFAFATIGELFLDPSLLSNQTQLTRIVVQLALTAAPFLVFWLLARTYDWRRLFPYRRRNMERARTAFADRWVGLCHRDDEAVQGLGQLSRVRLSLFEPGFAVPTISFIAVFSLPFVYLYLIASPTTMLAIADYLKNEVYEVDTYRVQDEAMRASRREIRKLGLQLRLARRERQIDDPRPGTRIVSDPEIEKIQKRFQELRQAMHAAYPNLTQIDRASRFRRKFLEAGGKPCEGGRLCGGGRDVAVNSRLMFHLATDEAASLFLDEELRRGALGSVIRFTLPILLVPIVLGFIAIALVLTVQFLSGFLSAVLSQWLDRVTWKEIQRTALGNDADAEIATGAGLKPPWIDKAPGFLPDSFATEISAQSDLAMSGSVRKLRASLSHLAIAEANAGGAGDFTDLLTWQELIHWTYFEVPSFRRLIAAAIAETDAFRPRGMLAGYGSMDPSLLAALASIRNPQPAGEPAARMPALT